MCDVQAVLKIKNMPSKPQQEAFMSSAGNDKWVREVMNVAMRFAYELRMFAYSQNYVYNVYVNQKQSS